MKKLLTAIIGIISLHSPIASAVTTANEDVKEFINLLYSDQKLTISDYRRYYGSGAEDEHVIEYCLCELQGWEPSYEDTKCRNFVIARERQADEIESLYLLWLKTKLPTKGDLRIVSVDKYRNKGTMQHDVISATLNSQRVTMMRNTGSRDIQLQFGELGISHINIRKVHQLLVEDLKKRKAFFKSLVR
jgi:tRNA splicing endonuclease